MEEDFRLDNEALLRKGGIVRGEIEVYITAQLKAQM